MVVVRVSVGDQWAGFLSEDGKFSWVGRMEEDWCGKFVEEAVGFVSMFWFGVGRVGLEWLFQLVDFVIFEIFKDQFFHSCYAEAVDNPQANCC